MKTNLSTLYGKGIASLSEAFKKEFTDEGEIYPFRFVENEEYFFVRWDDFAWDQGNPLKEKVYQWFSTQDDREAGLIVINEYNDPEEYGQPWLINLDVTERRTFTIKGTPL